MPFTFSHPAIVLPFAKIKHEALSMSGLIIGSMTPDFEYFIRMKSSGRYSHSLEGILFLDIPLACLITIIFHQLVKVPTINSAPNYFFRRLMVLRDFNFPAYIKKYYLAFFSCVLVGIISHIVWDGFTHENDFFVNAIPYLSTSIAIDGLPEIQVFPLLQNASTIIGAFYIGMVFHRQQEVYQENLFSIQFWIVSIVVACIIYAIRASLTFEYFADIVATIASAIILGLIASSGFVYLTKKK